MTESTLLTKLGKKIKSLRMAKNMSQINLAVECNFEKATMSRIESGRANPTIRTLYKICTALDVQIAELFQTD